MNAAYQGVFGKYEMETCAEAIVAACEREGTWNICWQVPERDSTHHVGFTWLIHQQYLYPVPSKSSVWFPSQAFIKRLESCGVPLKLSTELDPNHGLYLPRLDGNDGVKFDPKGLR